MMRQVRYCCLLGLCLVVLTPTMQSGVRANRPEQSARQPAGNAADIISPDEQKALLQKLAEVSEVPLRVNAPIGSGVVITDAYVKAVSRDPRNYSSDPVSQIYASDHVIQLRLTLHNTSTHIVTGFELRFTNPQTSAFWSLQRPKIELVPEGNYQLRIDFSAVSGDPLNMVVDAIRINFWSAPAWKADPSKVANLAMRRPDNPEVDIKPRPINFLTPNYTELARTNNVRGGVRLFLLVGTDGAVKKVEVVSALPDGLTETAVKIARVLQFRPAMRGGAAVEYTVALEIEFDSQGTTTIG